MPGSCFWGISDWVLEGDQTTARPRLADSGEIGYTLLPPGVIYFKYSYIILDVSFAVKSVVSI